MNDNFFRIFTTCFIVFLAISCGVFVVYLMAPQMGHERAIMLVVAFYVLLWGVFNLTKGE